MNKSKLLILVSLLLAVAAIPWGVDPAYGGSGGAEQKPLLKTQKDMESYAIGVEVARNFKRQGIDFDLDVVIRGMKDVVAGNKLLLTDYDLQTTLNMITSRQRQKKAQARLTAGEDNKKKGQAFLAENKANEGVVTLPSGLQY
ncbi:MAG TPA: FKBP-type peptidyl-prolyl cis-trans isomerase N-terminal domain-containing protein, partial [Syntrophales bacterium]